ncbi:MAG: sugar kinase [Pseudorhodobacter sp.]|nr:sugar kinase [Pseudorhodobacter sp.]
MGKPTRIACIGECMIELGQVNFDTGQAHFGFAGDTLNTATYLARLLPEGFVVSYITNLGTDAFSNRMLNSFAAEGIDSAWIGRHDSRLPGLYAIEIDAAGERSFHYWRDSSAARTLFSGLGTSLDDLAQFDVIYLSGISLAILPDPIRSALIARLRVLHTAGCMVVFDSNYRPRLWPDAATARDDLGSMWCATSLALPSLDDEQQLYPGTTPVQVLDRIAGLGVGEIVLKSGAAGVMIRQGRQTRQPDLPRAETVVDSTGAGDSFNAGYLAARLRGADADAATEAGHRLACRVIGQHGAILPRG